MFIHFKKITKSIFSTMFGSPGSIARSTVIFTLNLLTTIVTLAVPFAFISALSTEEEENRPLHLSLTLFSSYAVGWSISRLLPYLRNMLLYPMGTDLAFSLTQNVMKQFYDLPMEYRVSNTNAPAVQHFGAAYEHIGRTFITILWGEAIPAFTDVLATIGVLSYFYWKTGTILGGVLLAYMLSLFFGSRIVGKAQNDYIGRLFEGYEYIIAQLDQYENAHYYGNVEYELNNLRTTLTTLNKAYNTSLLKRDGISALQTLFVGLGFVGVSISAGFAVLHKEYDINDYIWIIFYSLIFSNALGDFARAVNLLYGNFSNFKELQNYLSLDNAQTDGKQLRIKHTGLAFKNVTFSYKERIVLSDVSFEVPSGKTTVVVGLSGQGKSTILKLLLNFYQPQSGQVMVDDEDISKLNRHSLIKAMAIVPQAPNIFNGTLSENIKYGNLTAKESEIRLASRYAGLEEFTNKYGFDTSVGEKGARLSGGQKQRVSIARAYLREEAPYLILDEPTSSLDPQTEEQVLQDLNTLMKSQKKTTLLITHKLSTISYLENIDNIIVLDKGKVAEKGSVSALLAQNGIFAKQMAIVNKQVALSKEMGSFVEDEIDVDDTDKNKKGETSEELNVNGDNMDEHSGEETSLLHGKKRGADRHYDRM